MFASQTLTGEGGPTVSLLSANNDPLGSIAACAKMYLGEVVTDLSDVTDDERRFYLGEIKKTKLKMPLESVQMHFMLEGVTRGFTHQLVRQRTAAYAQESMRFAVIEDSFVERVGLPPSLAGSDPGLVDATVKRYMDMSRDEDGRLEWSTNTPEYAQMQDELARMDKKHKWRKSWDEALKKVDRIYAALIADGMPAEDARGLLPTNILTRVNYITNFRGLLDHAGNRLCTQAQFEWRTVFAQIASALRAYGRTATYRVSIDDQDLRAFGSPTRSSAWQFDALADLLRPVCYQVGNCVMQADFDRKCSIRDRVEANARVNRPSSEWHEPYVKVVDKALSGEPGPLMIDLGFPAIHPAEWLADPSAAR